jgi:[protein-PII] uridylyltransferase
VLGQDGGMLTDPYERRHVADTLARNLADPGSFDPHVSQRLPRQVKAFLAAPEVSFTQDEGNARTELRLTAIDRPGLLSRIGQVFARHGVRVISAKVATVGATAEDTFLIIDADGAPLTDPAQQQLLREQISEILSLD